MSHPIRWQSICGVCFYRMGTTLIAEKNTTRFVIQKYSNNAGWEARWGNKGGLGMPTGGASVTTLRDAIDYLRPQYAAA